MKRKVVLLLPSPKYRSRQHCGTHSAHTVCLLRGPDTAACNDYKCEVSLRNRPQAETALPDAQDYLDVNSTSAQAHHLPRAKAALASVLAIPPALSLLTTVMTQSFV